jgi:hypothetical protein
VARFAAQHTYQRLHLCDGTLKGVGLPFGVHGHGQQHIVLEPAHERHDVNAAALLQKHRT